MNQRVESVSLDDLFRSVLTGSWSTLIDAFNGFRSKEKKSVLVDNPESGQSGAKVEISEKYCEGY